MPSRVAGSAPPMPERNATQELRARGQFRGWRPALNPARADIGTFADMQNLVMTRGQLTYDAGWARLQDSAPVAAPVPLGGIGALFPGGATGSPIMLLDWYPDASGSGAQAIIAVTADDGARNGTLFYYPTGTSGPWTASVDLAAVGIPTDKTHVMDSCLYPISYTTAGPFTNPRGTYIFTTGIRDTTNGSIYIWPALGVGNYAIGATPGTKPDLSGSGNFSCRSLAATHERVYAFNTLEGTAANRRQPNRLRWTRPGWSVYISTIWSSTTGLGAGFQDLTLVPGEGVAVREHGRNLTCYFEGGVVIMAYTGQIRPHLQVAYTSNQRGLLGTRALVDIGGGVHFGAFTDGFWFLSSDGTWNEAGIDTIEGLRFRKFTDYFFSVLDRSNAYRMQLGFYQDKRRVYISFPTGTGAWENWVYDIQLDEMFRMTGTVTGLASQDGTAYAMVGSGSTQTGRCFIHGTTTGHVWEHLDYLSTRDGAAPTWLIQSHEMDYGDSFAIHSILNGWVDAYAGGTANDIRWRITDARLNASVGDMTKNLGTTAARGALRFPFHSSGSALRHLISGTHPTTVWDLGQTVQRTGETP